jgi:hypothetical protein
MCCGAWGSIYMPSLGLRRHLDADDGRDLSVVMMHALGANHGNPTGNGRGGSSIEFWDGLWYPA